jgi:hypothetical protein
MQFAIPGMQFAIPGKSIERFLGDTGIPLLIYKKGFGVIHARASAPTGSWRRAGVGNFVLKNPNRHGCNCAYRSVVRSCAGRGMFCLDPARGRARKRLSGVEYGDGSTPHLPQKCSRPVLPFKGWVLAMLAIGRCAWLRSRCMKNAAPLTATSRRQLPDGRRRVEEQACQLPIKARVSERYGVLS